MNFVEKRESLQTAGLFLSQVKRYELEMQRSPVGRPSRSHSEVSALFKHARHSC